jgi:hypothetical protein
MSPVKWFQRGLFVLLTASGGAWACGQSSSKFGGAAGVVGAPGSGSSSPGLFIPEGTNPDGGTSTPSGGSIPTTGLTIKPSSPTLTVVTGQPVPTVRFTATDLKGNPENAVWSIDRGELGNISSGGLFTPTGTVAGTGTISAVYGSLGGTTPVTVNIQTTQQGDPAWSATLPAPGAGGYGGVGGDGPGAAPTAAQMTALNGTPTADASVSILYPYDGTVWPQGLLAPLLQWNPGAHAFDSVYVDIREASYEYKGYFAANKTPFVNLPIPQQAWNAMTLSSGTGPVTVTLVFAQGATAFGPYSEKWTIAQATLHGTIYYNSYGTTLVKNSGTDGLDSYGNQYGAGTLSIASGATSPTLAAGVNSVNPAGDGTGCRVCHTVSGDGKSLVTQASNVSATDYSTTVAINLANDATRGAGTPLAVTNLAFPALRKDGSQLLSSSGGMIDGDTATVLYTMPAGTPMAGVTGLPANFQAALPAFSPDSAHVSFNFWGGTLMAGAMPLMSDTVSLAVLDFDGKQAFSNPRVLYTPPKLQGALEAPTVTFSSFLPDSSGVVFEVELTNDGGFGFTWHQNTGELWWVDMATAKAHRLDQLNGWAANGTPYLPGNASGTATHTAAQDVTLNYEATVNPIASGGYAWVVFTSRRMYGNVAQLDPWTSDPRAYTWLDQVTDKKLWVAAVDLGAAPGTDPSHPAFYLPAQELHAGNSRGYWSVDVCLADGQSCQTGDQCCGGYCQQGDAGLVCSAQKPVCAGVYDKCMTTSDCCDAAQGIHCVNDICAPSQPPR